MALVTTDATNNQEAAATMIVTAVSVACWNSVTAHAWPASPPSWCSHPCRAGLAARTPRSRTSAAQPPANNRPTSGRMARRRCGGTTMTRIEMTVVLICGEGKQPGCTFRAASDGATRGNADLRRADAFVVGRDPPIPPLSRWSLPGWSRPRGARAVVRDPGCRGKQRCECLRGCAHCRCIQHQP